MVKILEYASEIPSLTPEVVKILNEAVFQKFENVEKKFFEVLDFDSKWGYSKSSEEFVNFNFLALKSLLKAFNENERDEIEEGQFYIKSSDKQIHVCEMVTTWLKASELEDEDKNMILSLVGLEYMNIWVLVEVLDKVDTKINEKLIRMVKMKEENPFQQ